MQWVFAPDGKVLGLEPFSVGNSLQPYEIKQRLHSGAKRGDKFCIAAMRAILHSKVS